MKSSEIVQGETYLFLATDSASRKHLEGEPFTVIEIKSVWRRIGRKRKVKRFFNEAGDGARAEELEPIDKPHVRMLESEIRKPGEVWPLEKNIDIIPWTGGDVEF